MKRKLFKKAKFYSSKVKQAISPTYKQNKARALEVIKKVFKDVKPSEIHFKEIHSGYTNFSFLITLPDSSQYQVRLPHDGEIINRKAEHDLLFHYLEDKDYIYFDEKTGIAVKKWIPGKCPKKFVYRTEHFLDQLFKHIKKIHEVKVKPEHKIDSIKFDAYNQDLYRLRFAYKKKFLCLIDRRRNDKYVINHTDINPLNIIYDKETKKITLIDFEWASLAPEYYDYANFIRETGLNYKKIDWSKYIKNFNMNRLEQYLFMISVYSFLWTYAMPQTKKIIKYRKKTYKEIKKYYPATINVDGSCYMNEDEDEE